MYFAHFGLDCPPFKITPNPDFFYSGANRGAILDALVYAITSGEGIVKVVGEVGCGKTMLCRMLETRLPKNIEIIYLANPSLNRDEIFHAIASDLNIATDGRHTGEILRSMQNYLIEKHMDNKQVVILIEEAQAMPLETLEEVRLLSNLETSHHKLLQIVLFGQPELDENLNLPHMRQLKERIIHSFWVQPMTGKDIPDYLMYRMRTAGYRGPDVFKPGAVKLLVKASGGITRRINILADKALLAVFADNQYIVQRKHALAAIADSEFAPPQGNRHSLKTAILVALILMSVILLAVAGWLKMTAPAPATTVPLSAPPDTARPPAAAPKPLAVPAPPKMETPPVSLLNQRLDATSLWLKQTDPNRFTIQLMTAGTDSRSTEQLEQFLAQAAGEFGIEQFYVFRSKTPQGPKFSVLFGAFGSADQAYSALATLPQKYRISGALLRTVNGIHAQINR